jgi:hypothetical protein
VGVDGPERAGVILGVQALGLLDELLLADLAALRL